MNDLISRKWLMECVNEGWIKFDTEKDKNIYVHLVRDIAPSAQLERPEQPESAKEYCAECNHIEMCRWYPYEGCEFRSLPSAQPETHDKRTETHACDLISRQAAIMAVKTGALSGATLFGRTDEGTTAYYETVKAIKALPSAQPQRKTGKWIKLDMHAHIADHKCTACGQECYVPTCMGEPMYIYCPNCGARMDGEANE